MLDSESREWIDYRSANSPKFTRRDVRALPPYGRLALAPAEAIALRQAALDCRSRDPYAAAEAEEFIQEAQRASGQCFSAATRAAVSEVLDSGFGALLIENLPTDPSLPPTPLAGGALDPGGKATFVSEFVAVALGMLADAQIFNFRQEGRGSAPLFDNIVPVRALRTQRGAGGFENNFPFHCESAWHRMRPDYVVLLGIKEDQGAMTLVSSVADILDEQLVASMPADSYRLKPPELYAQMVSAGIPLGTPLYCMSPPIDVGEPVTINVNFNGTDCRGPAAVEWLAGLECAAEENAASLVLGPGNALIFNNHRTCHTRTGFDPNFGPDARWFLRANFKKNLWAHNPAARAGGLSESDMDLLAARDWVDEEGNLTTAFLPFVENPQQISALPADVRPLAARALHLTPVRGSRIV